MKRYKCKEWAISMRHLVLKAWRSSPLVAVRECANTTANNLRRNSRQSRLEGKRDILCADVFSDPGGCMGCTTDGLAKPTREAGSFRIALAGVALPRRWSVRRIRGSRVQTTDYRQSIPREPCEECLTLIRENKFWNSMKLEGVTL